MIVVQKVPVIGSRWVWEIDKPHAVCLIEVTGVRWNGEEWWVSTRAILRNGTYPNDGADAINELSRFREAVTPVGSTRGRWERRDG